MEKQYAKSNAVGQGKKAREEPQDLQAPAVVVADKAARAARLAKRKRALTAFGGTCGPSLGRK